ncbi:hypothetical protein A2U01_0055074, partial [Trifolium medium]|nr:hypothetical protein [Trifolium medium]
MLGEPGATELQVITLTFERNDLGGSYSGLGRKPSRWGIARQTVEQDPIRDCSQT